MYCVIPFIQEVDGIYLSEFGVHQIKSLTLDLPRKKRKKMPNISDMEAGILAAIESVVCGEGKNIFMRLVSSCLASFNCNLNCLDDKGPMRDLNKMDGEKGMF